MPNHPVSAQTGGATPAGKRTCFVIAPIGQDGSDTRKESDQVLKHLIKKALEPDYEVERADDIKRPGVITVQIVQRVFDADLVVADLSERNPNVYYELAIRHATRKSAVHIISVGHDIPFDVQEMRVVSYDLTNPDSLDEARGKLREHVTAIEQGETVITPVQFAQILGSLKAGEDRDKQLLSVFVSLTAGISNLQAGMAELLQDLKAQRQAQLWERMSGQVLTAPANPFLINVAAPPASGFTFPTQPTLLEKVRAQKAAEIKKAKETKDKK